jgi:hypothetical protein
VLFSLLTALVITCVSCFIEVVNRAKVSAKACFGTAFLMYLVLAIAGNGIATLLASSIFSTQLPSSLQPWTPFFSAFLGVFAFQGVLSHTNIGFDHSVGHLCFIPSPLTGEGEGEDDKAGMSSAMCQ